MMRGYLETPGQKEFIIKEEVLHEAIEEILAEPDRDNKIRLTEGFFWRVILSYFLKTGEKMPGSEEMEALYDKIKPMITKALDEKGLPYEMRMKKIRKGDNGNYSRGWYAEWEERQNQ